MIKLYMHIHKHTHTINNTDISNKNIMRATYFAMIVSSILCVTKFLNYFITNSVAIQASALDSLLDITVSFANFITIRFTQKKSNAKFPYGYDKIASLVAFLQVILVSALAFYLVIECFEKLFSENHTLNGLGYGVSIVIFSLMLNTFLVLYQSKVIKKTGSLLIKADMLHYKTDFLTNAAILIGLVFVKFLNIYWIDPAVGLVAAVYLFFATFSLGKSSLTSLIDANDPQKSNEVKSCLKDNGVDVEKIKIVSRFTGTKNKVSITTKNPDQAIIDNIKNVIYNNIDNCAVEIILD